MAMVALEMAMRDALGQNTGLPLHALRGGAYRQQVSVAGYLSGTEPPAPTASSIATAALLRFSVKAAWGPDMSGVPNQPVPVAGRSRFDFSAPRRAKECTQRTQQFADASQCVKPRRP